MHPKSDFQIASNGLQMGKNDNDIIICWHEVIVRYYVLSYFFLIKFGYWSMFHVNIITSSVAETIFVYKGFDQKTRNWKYPYRSFRQCLETGESSVTKFGMNVWNWKLPNTTKCQVYSFNCFWIIRTKPVGGQG